MRCSVCGELAHVVLCDGPPRPGSKRKTCDARLCVRCAQDAGDDRHLCPGHAFGVQR
ncbi:MAG: hypothetical protein ACJ79R_20525 [Anaeromyxobacteraceae bacterium]